MTGVTVPEGTNNSNESRRSSNVESNGDAEKRSFPQEPLFVSSLSDPNLVTWDGPGDLENPKNWTYRRKWTVTIVISAYTCISTISTSIVAPALIRLTQNLHVHSSLVASLILSIFILAYAFGPFVIGPLSEVYGRMIVLQLANTFYLIFNTACGFAQSTGQILAFRFLAGLGGSAPLTIGGGILADCWTAEERGVSIGIYTLAPLLSPVLGPLVGGFVTERTTWRWVFWAVSITDGFVQLLGLFFLRETYPPKILGNKSRKLRNSTGNQSWHTKWETPNRTLSQILKAALVRPFILLGTQPIIQILALYMAFLYGVVYLVLTTLPILWTTRYHESIGIAGLNYISLGIGYLIGTQSTARINDVIYQLLKERRGEGVGRPEFRLPLLVPGSIFVPLGIFCYGWSAQAHLHWIIPNVGLAIFGVGMKVATQCTQTYAVDTYPLYAASAGAANTFLRSLAGFSFPLFAPYMYDRLDYGWGSSLIAFLAIILGVPAPFVLWKHGPRLRAKSQFAAGGTD
ncbi:MAG: hypothetical protein Q9191_000427 [Dirinaria sp. TL-2023a]